MSSRKHGRPVLSGETNSETYEALVSGEDTVGWAIYKVHYPSSFLDENAVG